MSQKLIGLLGGAAMALCWASAATAADNYRLMTGPQGGVWVPLGGALKDMWEKAVPGLNVQALPGAGIANVRGIEEGKAEIGFGNSITTVDAIKGEGDFTKPHPNVCNLATLYPQYFQVVVPTDAGIKSIKDLKGKAITTQPKGNTAEQITRHILQVNGLSYSDVKVSFLSYTDAVAQMQDGHVQAFTLGTTIPSGAVMDAAASRPITLLDLSAHLDAMRKINPGYTLVTIKAGTYPKQDKDVRVIGYATHLVVSCKLPEDHVYRMLKSISDGIPTMVAVNKAMEGLTVKAMAEDLGVPFHPGAKKFYRESGLTM
ncbi:MAG: TAXI family TRAP transporter solute-binding subunit [Proteobacteria bacterium]|nr:TAXI family TRAP transporter solute-binding subunit [Pseudomonadota bacterium]